MTYQQAPRHLRRATHAQFKRSIQHAWEFVCASPFAIFSWEEGEMADLIRLLGNAHEGEHRLYLVTRDPRTQRAKMLWSDRFNFDGVRLTDERASYLLSNISFACYAQVVSFQLPTPPPTTSRKSASGTRSRRTRASTNS